MKVAVEDIEEVDYPQSDYPQIEFPSAVRFLMDPYRYKVAYGGRGGAKSWNFARALIAQACEEKPLLVLCTREIQKSIEESVYRLLVKQISLMGLSSFFEIQKTKIIGINGSEFVFAGLRHNIDNLKSFEGVHRVWVEEAQSVSKASWEKLIPTIREDDSEIWISFNPELEDDETYQRFVLSPPTDAKVVKIGWQQNPWFPDVLRQEMEDCKRRSHKDYLHIWNGECKQAIDGAIFAEELTKAAEQHRITRVPVQSGVPVLTFWDLGQSDNTAIWFVQLVGMEYRLIDYYQASGKKMPHYFDVLATRGYSYGEHFLPHDADYDQQAAHSSIKQQFQQALIDNPALGKAVRIVPRVPQKVLGINAARSIFEQCVFDKEKTSDGLQCLRRYRYERDEETGKIGKNPAHDIYSHGADAFLCLAQHAKKPNAKKPQKKINVKWIK